MTNKKQKPTTAYDWEKVAKAALIELKVQTSINELNKGSRKFEPSAVGPLRMIVEQQFSLNDSGELFHTSHLSDKLFLETVADDSPFVFVKDEVQAATPVLNGVIPPS